MNTKDYNPCKKYACKIQKCLNGKILRCINIFDNVSVFHLMKCCTGITHDVLLFVNSVNVVLLLIFPILENDFCDEKCENVIEELRVCCSKLKTPTTPCQGIGDPSSQKAKKS